ncbi:hypothetical protein EDEG_01972 [Edhazardia aedis USNM 41457]|uniref:Uncharacterized protein n=1 Tax=Edhazardia aedis (strain USNM 41457) TaxID=1003232 RepID=J9D899_EDHAE|nr:hypothetical protein EDEG_01972 [Edhazardia aedis USNM 41457]|eukprot:EJW03734.1 hypothetical protein EDEG_01972 [Edhazardia aedis USNM 41457]
MKISFANFFGVLCLLLALNFFMIKSMPYCNLNKIAIGKKYEKTSINSIPKSTYGKKNILPKPNFHDNDSLKWLNSSHIDIHNESNRKHRRRTKNKTSDSFQIASDPSMSSIK